MSRRVTVIGAGHAAGQLAISLRQAGYADALTIIGDEPVPPYQRPPLSKKYLSGELDFDRLLLKPERFYAEQDIDLLLGAAVTAVDLEQQTVTRGDDQSIAWDTLVFATGSRVRELDVAGAELDGVHYLRSQADVDRIRQAFKPGSKLVVVGGGYIGLEVAAIARAAGLDVTIVECEDRLLSRVVAEPISGFYESVHTDAGVSCRLGCTVTAFSGDAHLQTVALDDGTTLPADLAIVGIGVLPNVELARAAGLACDNGIVVDAHCRASRDNVFAIGDCSNHYNPLFERRLRLESVPNALEQARAVAATIAGTPTEYAPLPWFWSDQYDLKLQIAGLTEGFDETAVRGSIDARQFACFYLREGRLIAVDAVNSPREFLFAKPLISARAEIPAAVLADASVSLKDLAGD